MKYRVNTRRFLNRLGYHSSAHIIAQVEDTSQRRDGAGHYKNCKPAECNCFDYPQISLIIADCTRSISLDFELTDDYEGRQNSFEKIDGLIADLQEFRAAMAAEATWQGKARAAKRQAAAEKV